MSRQELLARLNGYYEELSLLNREIERLFKEKEPSAEKISELLNRKDHLINQCIRIKEVLEGSREEETSSAKEGEGDTLIEGGELLEKLHSEESLNQELARESLFRIKEELKKIQESKQKLRAYGNNPEGKYGSINKKA